jgi:hypothetical protein
MTYRERRERKVERLHEWAEKRDEKAQAIHDYNESLPYAHDWAFITQPGRIPQRDALNRRQEKAWEHTKMADKLDSRAAGIQEQLDRSIYSDDHDAIDKLRQRITELEAERDHMKAVNLAIKAQEKRTGKPNKELTAEDLLACGCTPEDITAFWPDLYGWRYPTYAFSNLSGNIARNRKRLEQLETVAAQRARVAEVLQAEAGS